MSLKKKAAQVRAKGKRNIGEDSVLAHISPKEAFLLKMRGGSGRRDPQTGLPHFNENGDGGAGGSMGGGDDSGSGGGDSGGGWGGWSGMEGAPDVGTIGGGGYGTDADGMGLGGGYSDGLGGSDGFSDFTGYDQGLGFGDSDLGGFTDVGGFASPSQVSGWNDTSFDPFSESNLRRGVGLLAGAFGPVGGLATRAGLAATSNNPGKGFGSISGSTLGGMLGTALGGPLGGWAGSSLGGMLGGSALSGKGASSADAAAGQAAGRAAGGGDSSSFDLGGVLTGLAGLYQGNQAASTTNQASQLAQTQAQSLADMYGSNSPYAAQLRQSLERKDAASGRRSQYGPREVELQARLADVASRNAPNTLAANQQAYAMRQAGNKVGGQQLASVLSLANKTGLTGMAQSGLKGLWDGFGSGGGTTGTGGYSLDGMSFNNPSAYTAPSAGFEWPSAQGAMDYASEVGSNASDYWS